MDEVRAELHEKELAFKDKYADVINNLAVKYEKDLGVGYDMLCGIARAKLYPEQGEQQNFTDIEYNEAEMVEDYKEIERLSKIINENNPIK